MTGSALATLFRFELRMLLRDRRTILLSIVLPILVMPLLLFSSGFAERAREKRQQAKTYRYAVTGEEASLAHQLIAGLEPEADGDQGPALELLKVESADPRAELEAKDLHFYIEALAGSTAEPEQGHEAADRGAETAPEVPLPRLRLVYSADWDASETASAEMRGRLRAARRQLRRGALEDASFPIAVEAVAAVEERDLATASQVTGAAVGRFATAFLLLFLLTGGSVVAADAIAGEKERGTLETMLTTAASRREIVAAKLLLILAVGVVITVIQLLNLLLYVGLEIIEVPETFAVDLSAGTVVVLLLLFLPLAAIAGSVLLLVSGYAKSYKEFQLYFFPVFLLMLVPAFAAMLPGLTLRSAIVAVPIANLSVAVREVLVGRFDPVFLALAWLVSMAAAAAAGRATLRVLSTERLITASDVDRAEFEGGAALLPRHIWRWYAGMWVLIFLVSLNLQQMQSLRSQIFFNLLVVFLGGSLLILRRYRLPVREALALRPVKPIVWLAVLLGAPAFHLAGLAVAKLSFQLFPLPEQVLEDLGNTLLPAEMPLWELLLLIAVLPGICEEIAFRGVLLHALRRRFHPVVLCLVVGGVFALFHMTLVRLLPTAALGVVLCALTLATGSIFPAMLWHALNNALAIVAAREGIPLLELEPWAYALGALVAALALVLIWRNRTPYPDLRGSPPVLRARRS